MRSKKTNKNYDKKIQLLNADSPFSVQESYKALRTNLIFSMPGDGCKIIIVTSSLRGEGKSTTAINLALSFAQNQSKVLLLDCDLRLPVVAKKLGFKDGAGLSDLLVGVNSAAGEVQGHRYQNVHVLPAGTIPPNPTELLGSPQMANLLERLSKGYDYIIIDTPPVNEVADAVILSKHATGIVLVVRQNLSDSVEVTEALKKLEFAGAKILGFVLNGVDSIKNRRYKSKYGYGYSRSEAGTMSDGTGVD